ncbi:MAG: hypothetical protein WCT16_03510 [Candidatus Buchananbacteria bacterium]
MTDEARTKLFVITGTSIKETGVYSFKFMIDSQAPRSKLSGISSRFGCLHLRPKDKNYINPFKVVRGEPNAIGDDGVKRWEIFVFESGRGQIMTCSIDETPGQETEEGLIDLIKELPSCVLLMDKNTFERFAQTCATLPYIELNYHHFDGELATS